MVAIFSATSFSLSANNEPVTSTDLSTELHKFIKDIDIADMELEEYRVQVKFIVNSKNEVVVLSTSNPEFDRVLKAKLNYKTIKTEDLNLNKHYVLPIVFRK